MVAKNNYRLLKGTNSLQTQVIPYNWVAAMDFLENLSYYAIKCTYHVNLDPIQSPVYLELE